jgi:UDP-N-acetylmuramate dehydrogenase
MDIREHEPLGPKTTMRIGGTARFYGEVKTKEDAEFAYRFSVQHAIPLIVLGGGSNTIFANEEIDAIVVRIKNDDTEWLEDGKVRVKSGKILASLIMEAAERGLDLSVLMGIPGTIGGALFGNAGQGHGGIWLNSFAQEITYFADGQWHTKTPDECAFAYRESAFKHEGKSIILWETILKVPEGKPEEIKAEIERLINKRIQTQPHLKTAGSCFKSLPDGTPAWKLIEAAGLRGHTVGGIQVSEKHANFLLNIGGGTFQDALEITKQIKEKVPQIAEVEMRFYDKNGSIIA